MTAVPLLSRPTIGAIDTVYLSEIAARYWEHHFGTQYIHGLNAQAGLAFGLGGANVGWTDDHGGGGALIQSGGIGSKVMVCSPMMMAGTYTINNRLSKFTNEGKVDLHMNGTLIGNMDFYAAAYTTTYQEYSVNIPVQTRCEFVYTITGKHASSTDYVIRHALLCMTRTGAPT